MVMRPDIVIGGLRGEESEFVRAMKVGRKQMKVAANFNGPYREWMWDVGERNR